MLGSANHISRPASSHSSLAPGNDDRSGHGPCSRQTTRYPASTRRAAATPPDAPAPTIRTSAGESSPAPAPAPAFAGAIGGPSSDGDGVDGTSRGPGDGKWRHHEQTLGDLVRRQADEVDVLEQVHAEFDQQF